MIDREPNKKNTEDLQMTGEFQMTEDLQFIREQFEADGLAVPDSLSEDAIRAKLTAGAGASSNNDVPKKRRWVRPLIGVAACAVLTIALIPALLTVLPSGGRAPADPVAMTADENGLYQFRSYKELDQEMSYLLPEYDEMNDYNSDVLTFQVQEDMAAGDAADAESAESAAPSIQSNAKGAEPDSGPGDASGSGNDPRHSETYTQVEGIDEADIVKTDGKYIYYLSSIENQIIIAKAHAGKTKRVAAVSGSKAGSYIDDIYIRGNQLIVIGTGESSRSADSDDWTTSTNVVVYDISDRTDPKELTQYSQTGHLLSSRLVDGSLVLVTNDIFYQYAKGKCLPYVSYDGCTPQKLPLDSIRCFPQVSQAAYTVIGMMDLDTGKASKDTVRTKAVLGGSDEIYCSGENLYITGEITDAISRINQNRKGWPVFGSGSDEDIVSNSVGTDTISTDSVDIDPWQRKTQILKVSLNKGKVKYKDSVIVNGTVKNQWAMDERNGYFRVATTSEHDGMDVNNLYILDEKMRQVGACIGFAKDEHIEAVRYIKDKAYVITYRQTDPLFIIDLSDPTDPVIEGHVKISGFSTLLVPADADHLLGLGFGTENTEWGEATNGVKLALFDISDPSHPTVCDSKAFENMDSQVQYDHKALLVGPAASDADTSGGANVSYYAIPYEMQPVYTDEWDDDVEINYDEGSSPEDGVLYAADDAYSDDPEATDSDDSSETSVSEASPYGILVFSAKNGKLKVLDDLETSEYVNRCIYIDDYIYGICSDDTIEGFQVK